MEAGAHPDESADNEYPAQLAAGHGFLIERYEMATGLVGCLMTAGMGSNRWQTTPARWHPPADKPSTTKLKEPHDE